MNPHQESMEGTWDIYSDSIETTIERGFQEKENKKILLIKEKHKICFRYSSHVFGVYI
jgi:hypothetical protein